MNEQINPNSATWAVIRRLATSTRDTAIRDLLSSDTFDERNRGIIWLADEILKLEEVSNEQ